MNTKLIPKHLTPSQPLVLISDNRVETPYIENIPVKEIHPELWEEYKNSHSTQPFHYWLNLRNRVLQDQTYISDGNPRRYSEKLLQRQRNENKAKYNKIQDEKARQQTEKVVMPLVTVPLIATGLATAPVATLASLGGGFIGDVIGEELEEHHGFKKGTRALTGLTGGLIGPGIIKAPKMLNTTANYIKTNSPIFIPTKNTYTRGIGITDDGIIDAIKTGVIRGNPKGTEITANMFAKLWRRNRLNFRDIMRETKIPNIEQRYFSRSLTKEDFEAIKQIVQNKYPPITNELGTFNRDPLKFYNTYDDYILNINTLINKVNQMPSRIKSGEILVDTKLVNGKGIPISERFGPNSDYVGDGHPLSYWYPDGRNPFSKGYDYAGSKWGVRVLNPLEYTPFLHSYHLHPSFFHTPKLADPNVQIFRRLPFGLGLRVPKTWVINKFKIHGNKPITIEPAYIKDSFGKEIVLTPYPGTDALLQGVVDNTWLLILLDYFKNPKKIKQIKQTMGWGDAEIAQLQDEILRSIGSNIDVNISGVNQGFKTIGEARGNVLGKGVGATGSYKITLNRNRIPDTQTAIEGAIHEIGGHAKTMSIAPELFGDPRSYSKTVSEWFPQLTKLIEKNKLLGDEILALNEKGKFLSQFKDVSDVELYAEANKSWDLFDQLLSDVKRFKYVTSSQERYARGYTGQLYERLHGPSIKTKNIKELELYYTPESVEKFKNALLGITPIAVGVGAANK